MSKPGAVSISSSPSGIAQNTALCDVQHGLPALAHILAAEGSMLHCINNFLARSVAEDVQATILYFHIQLVKAEVHQLSNLFALQITEAADAFKRERFFVFCFFLPIVACSALRRAGIQSNSAAAIFLRNYHRKRTSLATTVPTGHHHQPKEGFLAGVVVHADAAHLADRFVETWSHTGTILMDVQRLALAAGWTYRHATDIEMLSTNNARQLDVPSDF